MGILKNGILGSISGKVGPLVTYQLFGKTVGRSFPKKKRKRKPTSLQLNVRKKMALSIETLKPIVELVRLGYSLTGMSAQKTAYSIATSHAYKCINGTYPNLKFDFTKMLFARGRLLGAEQPHVEITLAGLIFTWQKNPNLSYIQQRDQVMLLAYFPEKKQAVYIMCGAKRKTGFEELILPHNQSIQRVETYIAFISENRTAISDSIYTGSFMW